MGVVGGGGRSGLKTAAAGGDGQSGRRQQRGGRPSFGTDNRRPGASARSGGGDKRGSVTASDLQVLSPELTLLRLLIC
jgi:hypothetical protein